MKKPVSKTLTVIVNDEDVQVGASDNSKPEDIALMVSSAMYYFVDLFDNHQKAEQALMRCYWLCRDKGQFTEGEDVVRG